MKNMLKLGAFACALAIGQYGYAQEFAQDGANFYGNAYNGPEEHSANDSSCDQPTGLCYCLYRHDEPCYYNCWRCVEDKKFCKKKCCRYVPQNYTVTKCRYVPKYECETRCRYVPETYYVDQCIPCKRWVCDRKCRYTPRYYYKKTCCNPDAQQPVGGGGCATGCCPMSGGINMGE